MFFELKEGVVPGKSISHIGICVCNTTCVIKCYSLTITTSCLNFNGETRSGVVELYSAPNWNIKSSASIPKNVHESNFMLLFNTILPFQQHNLKYPELATDRHAGEGYDVRTVEHPFLQTILGLILVSQCFRYS